MASSSQTVRSPEVIAPLDSDPSPIYSNPMKSKIPSDSSPTSSNVIYPHLNHLCQCFPSWPLCFGAQRFVDVGALLQRLPRGPGALLPLRPRQVHQVQLGKDVPAIGACYIYVYIYIKLDSNHSFFLKKKVIKVTIPYVVFIIYIHNYIYIYVYDMYTLYLCIFVSNHSLTEKLKENNSYWHGISRNMSDFEQTLML